MTISKEERASWRSIQSKYIPTTKKTSHIIKMLDALEAAEARAEELRHQVFEHEHNANFAEGVANSALARAKAAERERDVLIDRIIVLVGGDREYCPAYQETCDHKKEKCNQCWIEWARQQARGDNHADNCGSTQKEPEHYKRMGTNFDLFSIGCCDVNTERDTFMQAVDAWNTRPIEDALRAENAKLKARVEAAAELIEAFYAEIKFHDSNAIFVVDEDKATAEKLELLTEKANEKWEALK